MIRLVDVVVSAVALVLSSPLVLLSAIGIKRASPGPVFFRAQRAGLGGRPFEMLKLRTMHVDHLAAGRITAADDPRVFPLGGALRRWKLDEVPQLLNVLKGEMSLVGPRPEDVGIVRERYDSMMWESLLVPPGVTGPGSLRYYAQESALPSDPATAERVYLEELLASKIAHDLVYVRHRSLGYQLEILARTAAGILGVRGLFAVRQLREAEEASAILASKVDVAAP